MTDTNQSDCETVVQLDGVTRRFGATTALPWTLGLAAALKFLLGVSPKAFRIVA